MATPSPPPPSSSPKKEPTQTNDTNTPQTTTNTNNNVNPQTMGYPPAMGYPPGQPGFTPQYNHYPYPHPPPAGTYYGNPPPAPYPPSGNAFIRGFLAMLIVLIIFTCTTSVVAWLLLRPEIPIFRVESLAVSDFNLSKGSFTADWDANVTVENPNHKLKIFLDEVHTFIYYKEDFVSSSLEDPMFLETESHQIMQVKMQTNNTASHLVGPSVVDAIGKERSGGSVKINLRMMVLATFKSGSWWTRHASMKVFCEDMKVLFVGGADNGVLASEYRPLKCIVFYA